MLLFMEGHGQPASKMVSTTNECLKLIMLLYMCMIVNCDCYFFYVVSVPKVSANSHLFKYKYYDPKLIISIFAQDISTKNVYLMYELLEAYRAMPWYVNPFGSSLLYIPRFCSYDVILGSYLISHGWMCRYSHLIQRILPEMRNYFAIELARHIQQPSMH